MSDVLKHKGYLGEVSYEDGVLRIQVMYVNDILIADCESVNELQSAFESLIDDYLQDCVEDGRTPDKPFSGSFNVRVRPATHKAAAFAAVESNSTLNAWVASAIEEKIERNRAARSHLSQLAVGLGAAARDSDTTMWRKHAGGAGASPTSLLRRRYLEPVNLLDEDFNQWQMQ